MNFNDAILLAVSWMLGGTVGALRAFRNGTSVPTRDVVSSGLLAGMIALMCVSYFFDRGITTPMAVCISIAAGITADDIVRITIAATSGTVKRFLGDGK